VDILVGLQSVAEPQGASKDGAGVSPDGRVFSALRAVEERVLDTQGPGPLAGDECAVGTSREARSAILARPWPGSRPRRAPGLLGEDLETLTGDQDGVLELGGQGAIRGHDRPLVVEHANLGTSEVDHGLDGEHHAGSQPETGTARPDVRDMRSHVHLAADSVTTELADHRAAFLLRQLLYGRTDITEACPLANDGDAGLTTPACNIHQTNGFWHRRTDREGGRGVAVESVQTGRHVHVDDVARPKVFFPAGHTVANDAVAAGANGCREALVPELTRRATKARRMLAHPTINVGCRDPGPKPFGYVGEGGCGSSARRTHAGNLSRSQDLDTHGVPMAVGRVGVQYRLDLAPINRRLHPGREVRWSP
jgi:hypothetical protein